MDFKTISELIKKDAPLIANMVSSFNPMAGLFIKLLSVLFGADNLDDLQSKISSDKDASLKLKKLELDHQKDLQQLMNNDTANAREREKNIVEHTGRKDFVISFFSITFLIFFFIFVFCDLFKLFPDDIDGSHIFNTLSNIICLIVSYYFGSCHPTNK